MCYDAIIKYIINHSYLQYILLWKTQQKLRDLQKRYKICASSYGAISNFFLNQAFNLINTTVASVNIYGHRQLV